jgi:hypothetical protein
MVCRYAGLLEASLEADRRARRLDAQILTSVCYTHWMLGDYERAITTDQQEVPYMKWYGLGSLGRVDEALALIREVSRRELTATTRDVIATFQGSLLGDAAMVLSANARIRASGFRDPEGFFLMARNAVRVGEVGEGLALLAAAVDNGWSVAEGLERDAWLDPVRADPAFQAILDRARDGSARAAAAFREHGGERLLAPS